MSVKPTYTTGHSITQIKLLRHSSRNSTQLNRALQTQMLTPHMAESICLTYVEQKIAFNILCLKYTFVEENDGKICEENMTYS